MIEFSNVSFRFIQQSTQDISHDKKINEKATSSKTSSSKHLISAAGTEIDTRKNSSEAETSKDNKTNLVVHEREFALKNINITINDGEYVAILGANGSGKSTFARLINGLFKPTSGFVKVDSFFTNRVDDLKHIRQRVGFVFQNPDNQIVASTVEEDIAFGPENLGVEPAEIRKRVYEALDLVGMIKYSKHEPHMLSGGQKQRVAIAGALAMQPKYLVLDEATSMLDAKSAKEIIKLLHHLNREEKITIVSVTHFSEEAILADRVVVLNEGKTLIDDNPRAVFNQPELLLSCGVALPQAWFIAEMLRENKIKIKQDIINLEELIEDLVRIKLSSAN